MTNVKELLLGMSSAVGVSGREEGPVSLAEKELSALGQVRIDALGNLICTVKEPRAGQKHFMLDAHVDEIGMIVTYIEENGFLKVAACGGFDRKLLLASQVEVHTDQGVLPGVICSIPPHLQSGEKPNPKIDEIYIDIGCGREEAARRTAPGDIVTFHARNREMLGGYLTGKALDNRAGCVTVMRAAQLLSKEELDCGISVTLTSREEINAAGAAAASFAVNPTHAITVDVSFAYTPDAKKDQCGELGKGPMIGISPILSREMSDQLIRIAKEKEIPWQVEIMGGETGTNADAIVPVRGGIRTAVVSIPQAYMHTPVEKIDPRDVENAARLLAEYVKEEAARHA
ncbi:MAG: M42 family peptidase [Oscillospiraceae bacterium]|nr:M42 family peptidase [Oscillospiraceae bacterium]